MRIKNSWLLFGGWWLVISVGFGAVALVLALAIVLSALFPEPGGSIDPVMSTIMFVLLAVVGVYFLGVNVVVANAHGIRALWGRWLPWDQVVSVGVGASNASASSLFFNNYSVVFQVKRTGAELEFAGLLPLASFFATGRLERQAAKIHEIGTQFNQNIKKGLDG